MGRILGFAVLAGAEVGAAAGSLFTLFGAMAGMVVGALLGLLSGVVTVTFWPRRRTPDIAEARLLVMAPPQFLLVAAVTAVGLVGAFHHGGTAAVAFGSIAGVVAVPLTAVLTWCGAPWLRLAGLVDAAAEEEAWQRTQRAALVPAGVIVLSTLAYVVAVVVAW